MLPDQIFNLVRISEQTDLYLIFGSPFGQGLKCDVKLALCIHGNLDCKDIKLAVLHLL